MNRETLPMIGKLLGHLIMHTTARYTHLDDGHVFDAVEQVGAEIARMTGLRV
jgi:site-specific recombinase XerD